MPDAVEFMILAEKIISKHPELADFQGPASEEAIEEASKSLGVTFPHSYLMFLRQYGVGDFNGNEFYGIINQNLHGQGVPNVIWVNSDLRNRIDLSKGLLVIAETGYGPRYSLDLSAIDQNNDARVVLINPQASLLDVTHNTFAEFFFDRISSTM